MGGIILVNSSGFTLIELIIVLAIVAIIGAILIPNFLNTTDRARLRSDVQSARVLQTALDLHNVEQPQTITSGNMQEVISALVRLGYIEERRVALQTYGAEFYWGTNGNITVNISRVTSDSVHSLSAQLSPLEQDYLSGARPITGG